MSFAKNLRTLRTRAGFTQDELAQKVNVTRQAISNWERGRSEPDFQMVATLADILGVDANELIFGRKNVDYPKFQKYFIVWTIASLSVVLLVLLMQITLYPYLKKLSSQFLFTYLFEYNMIVPTVGYFFFGVLLISCLLLFFKVRLDVCWKNMMLIVGVLFAIPVMLINMEIIIDCLFPSYTKPLTYLLFVRTLQWPYVQRLLFTLFPTLSGMICFLALNRPQGDKLVII